LQLRKIFRATLIATGGYDADSGNAAIERSAADLIAFGVPFLANPDLPLSQAGTAQHAGPGDVLCRRRKGLHRLSHSG
jgi:2,4-dienoyl-CoA reductase-like NADH-dependent reductase (Old Yellow Enzyme family)